jgi:nucleolar GTP-binding protein
VIADFIDCSEQCGYPIKAQIELFKNLKPLFSNKLVFIVCNKIDILKPEELDAVTTEELQSLLSGGDVELLQTSCNTQEGVQDVKNAVCERLIAERVSQKLKAGTSSSGAVGGRLADVMARIHVAQPMNGVTRETFIPDAIKELKKYDKNDPERRRLARDVEEENGGAGVYNVDLRADYILDNPEWKHDRIPEIFDGKNVYDYIDPDIDAKLQALEEEEERLEAEGYYDSDEEIDDAEEADIRSKAELIREKQALIRNEAKMRKSLKNQAIIPRKAMKKPLSELEEHLDVLGVDTTDLGLRARSSTHEQRGRSMSRSRLGTEMSDAMDVDSQTPQERFRSKSRAKSRARSEAATNRREDGVTDELTRTNAERAAKVAQRKMNRMARQGEADRHVPASMPKHLVSISNFLSKIYKILTRYPVCWQAFHGQDVSTIERGKIMAIYSVCPYYA